MSLSEPHAPVPDGSTGANSDFQIPTISKTFISAGGGGGGPGPGGSAWCWWW